MSKGCLLIQTWVLHGAVEIRALFFANSLKLFFLNKFEKYFVFCLTGNMPYPIFKTENG